MITVTESAKKQAIRLMEDDNMSGAFIRVGVEGGGCEGLSIPYLILSSYLFRTSHSKVSGKAMSTSMVRVIVK